MISDFDVKRYNRHKGNIEKVLGEKFGQSVLLELVIDFGESRLESLDVSVKLFVGEVLFIIRLDDVILLTSGYERFFYENFIKCDSIKFIIKNIDKFKQYEDGCYIKYFDLMKLFDKSIT